MLTFEEKLAIIESFPQLQRKDISLGRVNFHFEESVYDKKIVVQNLHPNGNGFVYARHLRKRASDDNNMVNIRDFSEDNLRTLIEGSINYLSHKPETTEDNADEGLEGYWYGPRDQKFMLRHENELWNVYVGNNLEMAFESYKEAERYMRNEGFAP